MINPKAADFAPSIDIAAAVNDEKVLANCLLRSPDVVTGATTLRTYVGYATAGAAYNRAMDESDADYLVLAHQDVYLPKGYLDRLRTRLAELERIDPDWAVAGPIGLDTNRDLQGQVWCSSLHGLIGSAIPAPAQTLCLDELLIVVRRASGVRFDEKLPSFHMFGTDVILTAREMGLASYIVDAPVVHHSRPVISLGGSYQQAYRYMQSKWRRSLPIHNLICTVYPTGLWLFWRNLQLRRRHGGRMEQRPEPVGDPVAIARQVGFEAVP